MKNIHAIILAMIASGNAYACELKLNFTGLTVTQMGNIVQFEPVLWGESGEAQSADIEVTSIDCDVDVSNVTLSIAGKAREFCFDFGEDPDYCIGGVTSAVAFPDDGVVDASLIFTAIHAGKKIKRITVEGTLGDDDISSVYTVITSAGPNPQSP